ncbi:hypothetical protein GH714_035701 [Hevea brasiliensis]|uniref:Uncharacterized protein n=1 Tax=Hevea brasiliensis TaxID=3981 RepID=A0A6A6NEB3_HEVBR|nr:hypothetical protein GH714_035701 [Hevea brasiliensis]
MPRSGATGLHIPCLNCASWRLVIEANNILGWTILPRLLWALYLGQQYRDDFDVVIHEAYLNATRVNLTGDESQSMDIERFSDWGKSKTTSKRDELNNFLFLASMHFPEELVQGVKKEQPNPERVQWNPDSDQQKFNLFEKLEQKYKKILSNKNAVAYSVMVEQIWIWLLVTIAHTGYTSMKGLTSLKIFHQDSKKWVALIRSIKAEALSFMRGSAGQGLSSSSLGRTFPDRIPWLEPSSSLQGFRGGAMGLVLGGESGN